MQAQTKFRATVKIDPIHFLTVDLGRTVCATITMEASDETRSAHSLFTLANIASGCGRSIRRKRKRADAAARQSPTYCFGQRARDHCRKTCGERGDHRRGDRFEA